MKNNKLIFNYIPVISAVFLVIGLFLGKFLYQDASHSTSIFYGNSEGKVDEVIEKVVENYVDPVNEKEITEHAIKNLLAHLDPHSSYIPPRDVKSEEEQLNGKFDGVGIEFRVIDDTVMVVNAIKGGPSEKAGILAGDRIIGLNKQKIPLGKLPTDSLVKKLKGKAGSQIELIIIRPFDEGEIMIPVTRGEVPIFSINVHIMLNEEVGYIRINRFSSKTYPEFKTAVKTLQKIGAKKLVIDVRDNPGGYLTPVIDICDELLNKGRNIVYTKGENDREVYNSNDDGEFTDMDLAVITNQKSASASEILAGALQDNDKAIIVGRRTFGKGLVQTILKLKDNSRVNLTTSRYYTPSGRCIQKPFEKDKNEYYHYEEINRWQSGELYSKDSIKVNDSLKFETIKGRTVYGGGGIIPDVFVPYDTTMKSDLFLDIRSKNLITNFAVKFFTAKKIKGFDYEEALQNLDSNEVVTSFKAFCETKGVLWSKHDWKISKKHIINKLLASILKVRFGNNGYVKKSAEIDKDIKKALEVLTSTE